jgi:hypothetical protein
MGHSPELAFARGGRPCFCARECKAKKVRGVRRKMSMKKAKAPHYTGSPVPEPKASRQSCPVSPTLSSCPDSPVLGVPSWQSWEESRLGCNAQAVLSQLSCSDCPVPEVLSRLSCPGSPVPAFLSRLSCCSCTVPAVLS